MLPFSTRIILLAEHNKLNKKEKNITPLLTSLCAIYKAYNINFKNIFIRNIYEDEHHLRSITLVYGEEFSIQIGLTQGIGMEVLSHKHCECWMHATQICNLLNIDFVFQMPLKSGQEKWARIYEWWWADNDVQKQYFKNCCYFVRKTKRTTTHNLKNVQ